MKVSNKLPRKLWKHPVTYIIGFVVIYLLAFPLMGAMNDEFKDRGESIEELRLSASKSPIDIYLIINEISEDKNAVSAALKFKADITLLPEYLRGKPNCLTAYVADRNGNTGAPPQKIEFDCTPIDVGNSEQVISDINKLSENLDFPGASSVDSYPFDNIMISPSIEAFDLNGKYVDANYYVVKHVAGKVMYLPSKDKFNWDIHFARSGLERIVVLLSALGFTGTCLTILFLVISDKNSFSATQDLIAFASYFLAAAGFKTLIDGDQHMTGVLDLIVMGVPMVSSIVVVAVSLFKRAKGPAPGQSS